MTYSVPSASIALIVAAMSGILMLFRYMTNANASEMNVVFAMTI